MVNTINYSGLQELACLLTPSTNTSSFSFITAITIKLKRAGCILAEGTTQFLTDSIWNIE